MAKKTAVKTVDYATMATAMVSDEIAVIIEQVTTSTEYINQQKVDLATDTINWCQPNRHTQEVEERSSRSICDDITRRAMQLGGTDLLCSMLREVFASNDAAGLFEATQAQINANIYKRKEAILAKEQADKLGINKSDVAIHSREVSAYSLDSKVLVKIPSIISKSNKQTFGRVACTAFAAFDKMKNGGVQKHKMVSNDYNFGVILYVPKERTQRNPVEAWLEKAQEFSLTIEQVAIIKTMLVEAKQLKASDSVELTAVQLAVIAKADARKAKIREIEQLARVEVQAFFASIKLDVPAEQLEMAVEQKIDTLMDEYEQEVNA